MSKKDAIILVVNSGSSSLKLALFSPEGNRRLQQNDSIDFESAFEEYGKEALTAIGHRVVHGGAKYSKSVWIDDSVLQEIKNMSSLSPLHNIPSLKAIEFCSKKFPKVPQYAVFDTAFHRNMPIYAKSYAIPYTLAKKHSIERFGFHGIAHASSYHLYEKAHGPGKVINCHLGSGCSLAAIDRGISKDTSMGFTPNEGLMMATRSGDIDPGLFEFLSRKEGMSLDQIQELINFKSGLLGVSGVAPSMREVLNASSEQAKLAVDLFCYRVVKTIGAYMAVLRGVDAILFSGGIGENSPIIRKRILEAFAWQNLILDPDKNSRVISPQVSDVLEITSQTSSIRSCVVGIDESTYIFKEFDGLSNECQNCTK